MKGSPWALREISTLQMWKKMTVEVIIAALPHFQDWGQLYRKCQWRWRFPVVSLWMSSFLFSVGLTFLNSPGISKYRCAPCVSDAILSEENACYCAYACIINLTLRAKINRRKLFAAVGLQKCPVFPPVFPPVQASDALGKSASPVGHRWMGLLWVLRILCGRLLPGCWPALVWVQQCAREGRCFPGLCRLPWASIVPHEAFSVSLMKCWVGYIAF